MTWSRGDIPVPARLACAALAACFAGCGGGGDGPTEPTWSGVTIEAPADAAAFTTDQPTIALAGRAFVPEGSRCDAILGTIATGYRVRWRNAANGRAGTVAPMQLNCLLAVSLTWGPADVPLALGDNDITVTALAADGEAGQDTIRVRRMTGKVTGTVTTGTFATRSSPAP
jgi:hypothetical protein